MFFENFNWGVVFHEESSCSDGILQRKRCCHLIRFENFTRVPLTSLQNFCFEKMESGSHIKREFPLFGYQAGNWGGDLFGCLDHRLEGADAFQGFFNPKKT